NARWDAGELVCFAPGFEYWKNGELQARPPPTTTARFFKGKSTWLKLQRKGYSLTGYSSDDGREWTEAKTVLIEFPKKAQVGVAAMTSSDGAFRVEFEELKVGAGK